MTLGNINSRITFYTGADTNAFSSADRLIALNSWYDKLLSIILTSQDDWDFDDSSITATYPVATRALVAAQRDYKFSTALWSLIGSEGASAGANAAITPMKIFRADITYDGTNWYHATPFDVASYNPGYGNDTTVDGSFSKATPAYDVRENALWVYPLANASDVTAGAKIRLKFARLTTAWTSSDLSTGTLVPPIDRMWHEYLALGPALDYALAKQKANKGDLMVMLQDYEARIREWYGSKDVDNVPQFSPALTDYR